MRGGQTCALASSSETDSHGGERGGGGDTRKTRGVVFSTLYIAEAPRREKV